MERSRCLLALPLLLPALARLQTAEPDPAPADGSLAGVRVVPQALDLSYEMRFREDGRPGSTVRELQLELEVQISGLELVAYGPLHIDSIQTDTGTELALTNRQHRREHHVTDDFRLRIETDAPDLAAQRLSLVRGSLPVELLQDLRRARLMDLATWIDQPMAFTGMPALQCRVHAVSRDEIRLEYNAAFREVLHALRIFDAQGEEYRSHGRSRSSDGQITNETWRGDWPADPVLVIEFIGATRQLEVPILLEDLPLPERRPAIPEQAVQVPVETLPLKEELTLPPADVDVQAEQPADEQEPVRF
ncbi:MAG: hypothetical protein ACOCXJ_00060 [Planctomycetota bacterium]